MNITKNIEEYEKYRDPEKRYASFDYCYNYFMEFYEKGDISSMASSQNIQMSCLQLGFYLASWGMLRGSSFLLQKSVKHYEDLIKAISKLDKIYWEIDLDRYSDGNIKQLLTLYDTIVEHLGDNDEEEASVTLTTKIMLGVFGNIPAFDDNFCKGFKVSKYMSSSLLKRIANYYRDNKDEIDKQRIRTLDFQTGAETYRYYTKAKIVDMVGFIEGLKK